MSDAEQYAKHLPEVIHIFRPSSPLLVLDLTCNETRVCLMSVFEQNGVPGALIHGIAAPLLCSNVGHERDVFRVLYKPLTQFDIHGLFRITQSSTLGKFAEEYDIYRVHVPRHIG